MMKNEEEIWKKLLAAGAPTFTADVEPPYGLATRVLAGVREQQKQRAEWESMGLRAVLFSSLAVVLAAGITFGYGLSDRDDLDPGVKSLALVENVQVS